MEESAVFAPVEQEEIRADIGALFRGAIARDSRVPA